MEKLISYAQNFEDIILWRALSHVERGRYVDVGAQSPDTDSVSRLFHARGWNGVHVEPTPAYANQLRERRADEVVLQVAVSDKPGIMRFFEIAQTGLSTIDEAIADEHKAAGFDVAEIRVPTITLDTVLEQIPDPDIHWLKIDVEGAEALVVKGWATSSKRPWVVLIESTRPLSPEQTHHEWEQAVLDKGYSFVYFDGLNRFYVSNEHPELVASFNCGPNVFDNFSLSAASMFCAEANLSYHALQVHMDGLVAERDARVAQTESELVEVRAELDVRRGDLERAQGEHAAALNAMVQAQHRTLTEHLRMIESATVQANADVEAVKTDLHKQQKEANRWWIEAEALRTQLREMETSRSWQLTRPLRAVRRRMSGGVVVTIKQLLRPVATTALRVVFAVPGLRAALKPLIVRVPFIYTRFHSLAQREQLFDAVRPPARTIGGPEREPGGIMMDQNAQRVLADLRAACGQGASQ
jgi:FkbM family methyltransferase